MLRVSLGRRDDDEDERLCEVEDKDETEDREDRDEVEDRDDVEEDPVVVSA